MANRSEVRNPLDRVIERAVQLAQTPGLGAHVSGANLRGGVGQFVRSAATTSGGGDNVIALTQPAGDGSAGNPIRTVNVMFWGMDNWGESLWG